MVSCSWTRCELPVVTGDNPGDAAETYVLSCTCLPLSSLVWHTNSPNFLPRVNVLCWLFFGIRATVVLLQWHVKVPCHFTKIAGGGLHLNTIQPRPNKVGSALSRLCWPDIVLEPMRETRLSSHAPRQGTHVHSRLSTLSHYELTLAYILAFECARIDFHP